MNAVKYVIAVVAQAGIAYGLVAFILGPSMRGERLPWQKEVAEGEEQSEMRELGALLPVEEVLVNVADTGGRRFLKASVTLEIDGKDLAAAAPERLPILRSKVIELLGTKSLDDLVDPSSRDRLKAEILFLLNDEVSGGEFTDLHFTEFLVQ